MPVADSSNMPTPPEAPPRAAIGYARLAAGLAQGVALYLLFNAQRGRAWPATEPYLFVLLMLAALVLPVLLVASIGRMDIKSLGKWMALALFIVALLAWHDAWRGTDAYYFANLERSARYPSVLVSMASVLFFSVSQVLVMASARELRGLASPAAYADAAWRLAVQLVCGAAAAVLVWLAAWLCGQAAQVRLWAPVSCVAVAAAMHVADARAGLVSAIRSALQGAAARLLVPATVLVGLLLCAILATGLNAQWHGGRSAGLLLALAALLAAMIKLAPHTPSIRIAAALLLAVSLAGLYALLVRVGEYGWSSHRIFAAAGFLLAACGALGSTYAAIRPDAGQRKLAVAGLAPAWLLLAGVLALFTPMGDHARLSVASQMARLEQGKVPPEQFDFHYLKREGARYGVAALLKLKDTTMGEQAALIRTRAEAALEH